MTEKPDLRAILEMIENDENIDRHQKIQLKRAITRPDLKFEEDEFLQRFPPEKIFYLTEHYPYPAVVSIMSEPIIKRIAKLRQKVFMEENATDYINELEQCIHDVSYRASIILAWELLIYFLYKKIEEYELKRFESHLRKNYPKRKHRKINQMYDLKHYPDKLILEACFKLGFYDEKVFAALDKLRKTRNSSAHVNEEIIQTHKYLSGLKSIVDHIELIEQKNLTL